MNTISTVTSGEAFQESLKLVWEDGSWVGEKKELINVFVEIENPQQESIYHNDIVKYLDDFHGENHFDIVSQWTFPKNTSTNLKGEIQANRDDGEYFRKLCDSEKGNQIESMIEKIEKWGRNNRTVAQVFQVDYDLNQMFPPCLLDVQLLYRDGRLHVTGHYRSHTLAKSYYGDLVSLGRLQSYVADRTNLEIGKMYILSGSLHVRKKNAEHELAKKIYQEIC